MAIDLHALPKSARALEEARGEEGRATHRTSLSCVSCARRSSSAWSTLSARICSSQLRRTASTDSPCTTGRRGVSLGDAAPDQAPSPFCPSDEPATGGVEGVVASLVSADAAPLLAVAGAGSGAPSAAWSRSAMRDAHATMASVSCGLPAAVGAKVAGAAWLAARLARCDRTLPGSDSRAVRSERRKVGRVWRAAADAGGGDEMPLAGGEGGAGGVSSAAGGADPGCDEEEDEKEGVVGAAVMAAGADELACESRLVAGDDAAPLNDTLDALEVDRAVESGGRTEAVPAAWAGSGAPGRGCSGMHRCESVRLVQLGVRVDGARSGACRVGGRRRRRGGSRGRVVAGAWRC